MKEKEIATGTCAQSAGLTGALRSNAQRRRRLCSGFSAMDLTMTILTVVLLFGWWASQRTRLCRTARPDINCVNNLKQIGIAFRLFANDNNEKFPKVDRPVSQGGGAWENFAAAGNELTSPKVLLCPLDKARSAGNEIPVSFSDPYKLPSHPAPSEFSHPSQRNNALSYFISVSSEEKLPTGILSGDRRVEIPDTPTRSVLVLRTNTKVRWPRPPHGNGTKGNIALVDGSVVQARRADLSGIVRYMLPATNRLLLPYTGTND